MTFDPRSVAYPLEALRKREGWRLEALQSELAATGRRLAESTARHETLRREQRTVALAAVPAPTASIDPTLAQSRLLYLSAMQTRVKAAAQAVVELERSRDRLGAASRTQHARLEAIERHHGSFLRTEASNAERRDAIEADRDWTARADWREQLHSTPGGAGDPGAAHDERDPR